MSPTYNLTPFCTKSYTPRHHKYVQSITDFLPPVDHPSSLTWQHLLVKNPLTSNCALLIYAQFSEVQIDKTVFHRTRSIPLNGGIH